MDEKQDSDQQDVTSLSPRDRLEKLARLHKARREYASRSATGRPHGDLVNDIIEPDLGADES
jgi:hypothetical protein